MEGVHTLAAANTAADAAVGDVMMATERPPDAAAAAAAVADRPAATPEWSVLLGVY